MSILVAYVGHVASCRHWLLCVLQSRAFTHIRHVQTSLADDLLRFLCHQAPNMHDNSQTTQEHWALQAYAAQATCGSSVFPPQCSMPFSAGYANSGHQPCPEA